MHQAGVSPSLNTVLQLKQNYRYFNELKYNGNCRILLGYKTISVSPYCVTFANFRRVIRTHDWATIPRSSQVICVSLLAAHGAAVGAENTPQDTNLEKLIQAWPDLPEHITAAIVTMVNSSNAGLK